MHICCADLAIDHPPRRAASSPIRPRSAAHHIERPCTTDIATHAHVASVLPTHHVRTACILMVFRVTGGPAQLILTMEE